jgi:glycosyltransferase involved in cell wall biosynthesis
VVSNPSAYSGAEESLCTTLAAMQYERAEIHALIGWDGRFAVRLRDSQCDVHFADGDFSGSDSITALRLCQTFDRIQPDLVHVNSASGPPIRAISAAKGIPLVRHLRIADFTETMGELVGCDLVIAVSQFVRERFLRARIGGPDRITVVYDGVDGERFRPSRDLRVRSRVALHLAADQFVVLMVARFTPNKRHDILIRALKKVVSRGRRLTLMLVGESLGGQAEEQSVLGLIGELGLREHVLRLPFQVDLRGIDAASDLLVLCSENEPLGTCVLEGMSMELPAIVSAVSGTRELIDGETGIVIDNGDHDALADAIDCLLLDAPRRRHMGARARERVLTHFSARQSADALLEACRAVL